MLDLVVLVLVLGSYLLQGFFWLCLGWLVFEMIHGLISLFDKNRKP